MIFFVCFVIAVFVSGFVLGAWIGMPQFKRKRKPTPTTIPLASVVRMTDWRQLDLPAARRRIQIPAIKDPQ